MHPKTAFKRPLLVAAAVFAAVLAQATELRVEVGLSRAPGVIHNLTDEAVRTFARQTARLARTQLEERTKTGRLQTAFTLPVRVVLTSNGVPLPSVGTKGAGTAINPVFDSTGPRVFPSSYRTMLENVFTSARPTMDIVFGQPAIGGDVRIRNYDADIQDRYAVAGGYYIPNGPDGPEIRFPVYNDTVVSAPVNYVHCLLLAYQGTATYPFDAVSEGLVRAGTMRVVRTPGALPGSPPQSQVEATLDSLYDVSAFYDWYNQPALGCLKFIAPNLLNTQLPPGGSTGGIFLLRYQMAGTAWAKVTAEYPGFLAAFNAQFYASPGAYQTMSALVTLGQQVIDALAGGTGTIEGLSFADWVERQYILDTQTTAGMKIMVQPFPIDATPGTSDFGVFGIEVNAFRTAANGDESLLAGTSYPVYWRPDFVRFFASVQDDEIRFSGAYGSVVPNFNGAQFGNVQYRVAVDVPFLGGNTRTYLPAGSYSTGSNPLTKNFFGTLIGLAPLVGGSYQVSIEWVGGSATAIPVQNFAFGLRITDAGFNNAQPVTVRVFQNLGTPVEIFSRRINKGVGALAVTLSPPTAHTTYNANLPARLTLAGVPLQPYRVRPTSVFQSTEGGTLFARWNPTQQRYDLFPDLGQVMSGLGFYLRLESPTAVAVRGFVPANTPLSVSMLPGWNMFTVPFSQTIDTNRLSFTVATEAISTYSEALGTIIGNTIFEFVPDGGNPDAGTLLPATSFEAGKGYFVRALRPEGGLMVMTPNGFTFNGPEPRSPGAGGVEQRDGWKTRVTVSVPGGHRTYVELGQTSATGLAFDPRLDSELPPTVNGLQAAIVSDRNYFMDLRPMAREDTFRVVVQGLVPGNKYFLDLESLTGRERLSVYDVSRRRHYRFSDGDGRTAFYAVSSTQTFEVIKEGRR